MPELPFRASSVHDLAARLSDPRSLVAGAGKRISSPRELAERGRRASSVLARRLPPRAAAPVARARVLDGRAGDWAAFATAYRALTCGTVPADLQRTVARLLDRADAHLLRARGSRALELFDRALQLSYHPSVHHGSEGSPLATDPEAFLAPYRASAIGRLMLASLDDERPEHPGGHRILIVSHGSWTFIDRVRAGLERRGGLEISVLDLSTLPPGQRPGHREAVHARFARSYRGSPLPVPPALAAALDGVDTVFVEWGTYALAWLTQLDLPNVRVVARLHRFEAFTPYPQLAAFAQVDEMLFVSEAVRGMVAELSPRLAQAHRVRLVDNPHDYSAFTVRKVDGADRTLVQIGWAIPVKDALFTLDVLERLRADDPAWRLLLVGSEPPADPPARERAFVGRLRARLEEMGDAVEVLGRRDDVPEVLRRTGFVISSSRHEGTHESVAEGAAAGCVPVVRNWPEAARWGGAATVYPSAWVVEGVEDAVARILAHADPAVREAAGADAAQWVAEHRIQDAVIAPYEAAIRGSAGTERTPG